MMQFITTSLDMCHFGWQTYSPFYFFNFFFNKFIYLFLAVLGLCFCAQTFSSCCERGPLFVAVHGLLTVVAPPLWSRGSRGTGYSSCGTWAQ